MDEKFYKSRRWERVRQQALRRDNYIDQELKRYGNIKQAELVHHIFPVEEYPEYAYCLWNLISITRATHKDFHDQNNDTLTSKGIDLLVRTCRKQGIEVPERYRNKQPKPKKRRTLGFYG